MNELQITAYHEEKFQDIGIIKNGLKTKLVSVFMNDEASISTPDELFSISLLMCFYKTTKKILTLKKQKSIDIKVKVNCNTVKDKEGYFFKIDLSCGIDGLTASETKEIMELTHKYCPVSKMLGDYHHFSFVPVTYEEL
ncbi:OsmC family protein ['Camptotheca acuminata' phytoplasma]|uniref:OsmC family protein n=1 Tax='Camptotheca acuminata' phytoplasma TaxID=3239192 RepID=UPI00351A72B9